MSDFYSIVDEKHERETQAQLMAAAMSLHPRVGAQSALGRIDADIMRYQIAPLISRRPLPELNINIKDKGDFRFKGFDPHNQSHIDENLLLIVTVSVHHGKEETIFSAKVLPQVEQGTLEFRTVYSLQPYNMKHFDCLINRHEHGAFELLVSWHVESKLNMYGLQIQTVSPQNRSMRQYTPQGFGVEIRYVGPLAPPPSPVLHWPSPWPLLDWIDLNEPGVFYHDNQLTLSPHDQRFQFSLLVAGHVVYQANLVHPRSARHTMGCRIISGGFYIQGVVYHQEEWYKNRKILKLCSKLENYSMNMNDKGFQEVYLDDPEPQQHMRQDFLGGYVSFRVERSH